MAFTRPEHPLVVHAARGPVVTENEDLDNPNKTREVAPLILFSRKVKNSVHVPHCRLAGLAADDSAQTLGERWRFNCQAGNGVP